MKPFHCRQHLLSAKLVVTTRRAMCRVRARPDMRRTGLPPVSTDLCEPTPSLSLRVERPKDDRVDDGDDKVTLQFAKRRFQC